MPLKRKRSKKTLGHGTTIYPPYDNSAFQAYKNNLIFSPVCGIIDSITELENKYKVGIYIRGYNDVYYDAHSIFSPVTGKINTLTYKPGHFTRELKHKMLIDPTIASACSTKTNSSYYKELSFVPGSQLYKSHDDKSGKLKIKMKNINFIVEVGKHYITKNVVMYNKEKDYVLAGEHIGDILIGSYCILYIKKPCQLHIKEGDNVKGGISTIPIATI
jgi:hypothetical protein